MSNHVSYLVKQALTTVNHIPNLIVGQSINQENAQKYTKVHERTWIGTKIEKTELVQNFNSSTWFEPRKNSMRQRFYQVRIQLAREVHYVFFVKCNFTHAFIPNGWGAPKIRQLVTFQLVASFQLYFQVNISRLTNWVINATRNRDSSLKWNHQIR